MIRSAFLLLLLFLVASRADAAIAIVNHIIQGATATNNVTTSAVNTTGANLIVISVASYKPGGTVTISDSKSNTYTALTQRNAPNDARVQLYYCASPTVGSGHTFTGTSTGAYPVLGVITASGAAASPFDQESGSGADTGTTSQPGSLTPSQNNCLLVTGIELHVNATPFSVDSGFSADMLNFSSGNYVAAGVATKIQTTAGAENPTWTWTTSGANATAMAVFKASASSAKPAMYYYQQSSAEKRLRNLLLGEASCALAR